jgi:hypothetical protein
MMKKYIVWGLVFLTSVALAADEKTAVKELEKLSTENNSTEEQFSKSKSDKNWGNNQYGSGDRLVCESYRGQRQHCRADTSGGVRLIKQVGYNSCQGNWGYDYYGVWVANGCRAEFQIDRYQDHYGQTDDVVRCESYSYRRQVCASNLQGAEVQLIHQLSNRSCNGNWGFNQNEIWVSNGCKADFRISRNNYDSGIRDGLVECRSTGTRIEHCQVPELQSIELVQERGGSYRNSCRGNWGYSSHGIWVRNGCDAQFRVVEYHEPNYGNNGNNQGREVICESNYGQVRTCQADTSGRVEFVQSLSNTSCDQRWGYDVNGIWVKDGCRARFMTYPGNGGGVVNPPIAAPLPKTIKCKSRRGNVKICDTNGPFRDVEFKREISKGKYPCEGNWGVNQQGELFVKNNCYAEFKIYY